MATQKMQKFEYFLELLKDKRALKAEDSYAAFSLIADNKATNEEIKDFLVTINQVGISENLLFGAAKSLSERSIKLKAPRKAIDVCGTGGDNSNSLNISTTTAIVLASMGIPVAKHGNKAVSSKSGSADIFLELGIDLNKKPAQTEKLLTKHNLAFIYAPNYHPALKNVAQSRQELGVRTIFNFLGPLLNPAQTKYQLIGCSDVEVAKVMIKVCKMLGKEKVMVVTGLDGMDEISISDNSMIYQFDKKSGNIKEQIFNPENYEIKKRPLKLIEGSDPKYNASLLLKLLKGDFGANFDEILTLSNSEKLEKNLLDEKLQAYLDIVSINNAAALILAGKSDNFGEAIKITQNHIRSGRAFEFLENYRKL